MAWKCSYVVSERRKIANTTRKIDEIEFNNTKHAKTELLNTDKAL